MSTLSAIVPFGHEPPKAEVSPFQIIDDDEDPGINKIGLPDGMVLIRTDETPTVIPWKLPLMYKYGNDGLKRYWQIGFDGHKLLTFNGTANANDIDPRDVVENNSGRSLAEQGHLQALAKHKNKFHDGYVILGAETVSMVKGMKGYKYEQGKIKVFPVLISPKFNGSRALYQHYGGTDIRGRSYLNRPITHLKKIEADLLKLYAYLPAGATIDGELYRHGMSFHRIISAIKTVKTVHKDVDSIILHIFEIVFNENPPAEVRYNILVSAMNRLVEDNGGIHPSNIVVVPHTLAYSHEDIIRYKDYYVSQGYEGAVVKHHSLGQPPGSKQYELSRYKYGRSVHLYKVKDFIDEEGTVISVVDCEGTEKGAGKLIIRDKRGVIIPIRFGEMEDRIMWLQDPSAVVGKLFTFKYESRSETGVPIQPTGVAFRDYE